MHIDGSTILVTGASEGIGRAIATRLASDGARVLAVARTAERLEELAAEAPGVVPVVADVTDADERRRLVAEAGDLDVLVNNAGVAWLGLVEDMPADEVRRIFETDVFALIDLVQLALPAMLARGSGQIVNVGSVLGFAASPPLTVYSAAKAAVEGFTDGLRRELLGRGVDVTLVTPGAVEGTEVLDRSGDVDKGSPLDVAFRAAGTDPEHVAAAVAGAIARPRWPGQRNVSVPRWAGMTRFAVAPGVGRLVDAAVGLARSGDRDLH